MESNNKISDTVCSTRTVVYRRPEPYRTSANRALDRADRIDCRATAAISDENSCSKTVRILWQLLRRDKTYRRGPWLSVHTCNTDQYCVCE